TRRYVRAFLGFGVTLHHVRSRLPAEVRVIASSHPLSGQLLHARHVYRRYGRIWLVLVVPDGGVTSVAVEDTDVLTAEPVVAPRVGDTVVSIHGARRLLELLAAVRARTAQEGGGSRS
ncbi:MAG: hypothetical protein ACRDSE_24150, partial [Pseudonocardiaceae bacterium]